MSKIELLSRPTFNQYAEFWLIDLSTEVAPEGNALAQAVHRNYIDVCLALIQLFRNSPHDETYNEKNDMFTRFNKTGRFISEEIVETLKTKAWYYTDPRVGIEMLDTLVTDFIRPQPAYAECFAKSPRANHMRQFIAEERLKQNEFIKTTLVDFIEKLNPSEHLSRDHTIKLLCLMKYGLENKMLKPKKVRKVLEHTVDGLHMLDIYFDPEILDAVLNLVEANPKVVDNGKVKTFIAQLNSKLKHESTEVAYQHSVQANQKVLENPIFGRLLSKVSEILMQKLLTPAETSETHSADSSLDFDPYPKPSTSDVVGHS